VGNLASNHGDRPILESLEQRLLLSGTTYLVDSLADVVASDGAITLREAIEAANTNAIVHNAPAGSPTETDIITFDTSLIGGTILLDGMQLNISDDLKIRGLGAEELTIDADGRSCVFHVAAEISVDFVNLTITGGYAGSDGGGISANGAAITVMGSVVSGNSTPLAGYPYDPFRGGGIIADYITLVDSSVFDNISDYGGGVVGGIVTVTNSVIFDNLSRTDGGGIAGNRVTMTDSTVSGNQATGSGGGVYARGVLRVIDSRIIDNTSLSTDADGGGGGVYSYRDSIVLSGSTVSGNSAASFGGGLLAFSWAIVNNSLIADNVSGQGGGGIFCHEEAAKIANSTISGNSAYSYGGGVNAGFVTAVNSTIVHNSAADSGGVKGRYELTLNNTVVAMNTAPSDPDVDRTPAGSNYFIGADDGDPMLMTVTDSTGMAILYTPRASSPLVDAGSNALAIDTDESPLTTDQRGRTRINNAVVDIGAIEFFEIPELEVSPRVLPDIPEGESVTFTVSLTSAPASLVIADVARQLGGSSDVSADVSVLTFDADNWYLPQTVTVTVGQDANVARESATFAVSAPDMDTVYVFAFTVDDEHQTYVVDSLADVVAADGMLTLREAIQAAGTNMPVNEAPGGSIAETDIITFAPSLSGGAIVLDGTSLAIPNDLDIHGLGAENLTIDADSRSRVFFVDDNVSVSFDSLRIRGGRSVGDGGGIRAGLGATIIVTNAIISDNSGTPDIHNTEEPSGGGLYMGDNSTLTVMNSTISGNSITDGQWSAYGYGGGLYVGDNSMVTVMNSTINENSVITNFAAHGGGLYVGDNSTVTVVNSAICRNLASGRNSGGTGGGVACGAGGVIIVEDSTIIGNSSESGGGLYVGDDGAITVTNSTISDNSALHVFEGATDVGRGGGIFGGQSSTISVTDSTVSSNSTGRYGGGAFAGTGSGITVSNSTINGNTAGYDGGGIFGEAGSAIIVADSVLNVNSAMRYGGGIGTAHQQSMLSITNSMISNNMAGDGGGIYGSGSEMTVMNSTISGNWCRTPGWADGLGGGIFSKNTQCTLTNVTISGNSAYRGAGIYKSSNLTITDSIISDNSAVSDGGGVYLLASTANITDSVIRDNSSGDRGGGVFNAGQRSNTPVSLTNLLITGNWALNNGGGINVRSGKFTVTNSTITENHSSQIGGGVGTDGSGVIVITNSTIIHNSADYASGGIEVYYTLGRVRLNNTVVALNTAPSYPNVRDLWSSLVTNNTLIGGTPMLTGPILNLDGTTLYYMPKPDSPLVNAGDNSLAVDADGLPLAADQIGRSRIVDSMVDIGAAELPIEPVLAVAPSGSLDIPEGASLTLDVSLTSEPSAPITVSIDRQPDGNEDLSADTSVLAFNAGNWNLPRTVTITVAQDADVDDEAATFAVSAPGMDTVHIPVVAADDDRQTYVVDSLLDVVAVDGVVTLREAIQAANSNMPVNEAPAGSSADIITFAPLLAGGRITLDGTELYVTKDLEIRGLGASQLTIDADGRSRVFFVGHDVSVLFDSLTISGGYAAYGGGIFQEGDSVITVTDSAITGNSASNFGGGIYSRGDITIVDSSITDNSVSNRGGGISWFTETSSMLVINSTIAGNSAGNNGGGIWSQFNGPEITNSTIVHNSAGNGGGILLVEGDACILNNTVLALNTANGSPQIYGTYTQSHSFIDGDPMLGAITDGDGVVQYYVPLPGSPLVDAGSNALVVDADGNPLATDQIGVPRIIGPSVDIGAVEFMPGDPPTDIFLSDATVAENLPAGTIVGTLSSTDPNPDPTHAYTLVAGVGDDDNGFFTIDGDTVKTAGPFNFEARNSYSIRIRSTNHTGGLMEKAFTISVTDVNEPPVVGSIANVTVEEDASDTVLDLSNAFYDPEGDTIVLSVTGNTNVELVTADLAGDQLTLAYVADQSGSAEITIRATGISGAWVAGTFTVTVNPGNDQPFVSHPIGDVTVNEDASDTVLDLTNVFDDIDAGDSLTLSVTGNTNAGLVTTDLAGDQLTLVYLADQNGMAEITVRATDAAGAHIDDTFTVTVRSVNDAPFLVHPIADVIDEENAADRVLDLSGVFDDTDIGDELVFSVTGNTNAGLVTASIDGDQLTLIYAAYHTGQAEITVRATDLSGAWVDDAFSVTVNPEAGIHGRKFDDLNANGVQDPGEPGLDGWIIELVNPASGEVVAATVTESIDLDGSGDIDPESESGLYSFTDMSPDFVSGQSIVHIIDNSDVGFYIGSRSWRTTTGVTNAYNGDVRRYQSQTANAWWVFDDLPAGSYQIWTSWGQSATRPPAAAVRYNIYEGGTITPSTSTAKYADGTLVDSLIVDQTVQPSDLQSDGIGWRSLGEHLIDGQLVVEINGPQDVPEGQVQYAFADAVRIEGPPLNYQYIVRQVAQTGWTQTSPSGGEYLLEIEPDGFRVDVDFGDHDIAAPVITVDSVTTADTSPALSGAVDDPTAGVEITVDGNTYAAINNGDGTWTLDAGVITPSLGEGFYDVVASAADPSGNVGTDSTTAEVIVDFSPRIAGRRMFYNNSVRDGSDPAAGVSDDGAIAADKIALLPGGASSSANCSNYSRGINGIMVDVAGHPGGPVIGDFSFRVSDPVASGEWIDGPIPTLTVRAGEGVGGSDRVTLIWADGAIVNQWVEVTVKSDANGGGLGLAADDVFYFGNSVGDCDGDGAVDEADYGAFVGELGRSGDGLVSDFDGDRRVGLGDFVIMRERFGSAVAAPSFPVAAPETPLAASAPVVSAVTSEFELGGASGVPGASEALGSSVSSEGLRSLTDYWFTEVTSPDSPVANLLVESPAADEYVAESSDILTGAGPLAATSAYDLRPLSGDPLDLSLSDGLVDVLAESAMVGPL
jgi:large repetitive protein